MEDALIRQMAETIYAGEFDYQQAMAAGFQIHISKHVEPEELVRAICGRNGGTGA